MKTFQIYYCDGGNVGPFVDVAIAIEFAKGQIRGDKSGRSNEIEIRPSNSAAVGGFGEGNVWSSYVKLDRRNGQWTYRFGTADGVWKTIEFGNEFEKI